jgi:molybdate transport system substrate-binding protein
VAGSQVKIGKVGIGVGVRKGAPKPDISSLDAFKRVLITAKALGLLDPATGSPTGSYLAGAFDRLGCTADLKSKIKLAAKNAALFDAPAKGDVERDRPHPGCCRRSRGRGHRAASAELKPAK